VQIGLYISTAENSSLDVICERFVAAEELGFHTAWAGHTFEWDALSLLALAGRVTEGIELGSWVVPSFPRHPVAMAQQALTVQSACSGRLVLGIGVSHAAVIQKRMGIDYSRPVRHMREYLAVLPSLLAGDSVSHRGEEFYIEAQLDPGGAPAPPVLLAALGPQMLELAGRAADGVALWLGGAHFVGEFALARIDAGASAAGRPRPRVIVGLPVVVTKHAAARDAAEQFLALSSRMPAYRRVLEWEGAESPADAALIGDEEQVLRRLEALEKIGVSDFNAILFPVGGDPQAVERTRNVLADFAKGRG